MDLPTERRALLVKAFRSPTARSWATAALVTALFGATTMARAEQRTIEQTYAAKGPRTVGADGVKHPIVTWGTVRSRVRRSTRAC